MGEEKLVPKLRFNCSSEWKDKKLKDIIQISKEKYNPELDKINYKCIELEHLSQETGILLGFTDSINQNSIKNRFHEGNILFGKLRPYLKKYYFPTFEGVCSSEIWVFNTKEYSKYIYYLIQTKRFLDISNVSSGSKMPRSDWNFMKNYVFLIPDLKTQKEVANLFSTIDKKIELLNEKYESYVKFKNYLMQQIFAQKLRFDYEEYSLKDVCEKIGNGFSGTQVNYETPFPVTRIETISSGIINYDKVGFVDEIPERYLLNEGDILLTNINSMKWIGNSVYYDGKRKLYHGMNLMLLRTKKEFNSKYLYYYITYHNNWFKKMACQAVNQASINKTTLEKFKIKFPNIKEQNNISNVLSSADLKIEQINNEIDLIKKFKKGLLQQMFV